MKNLKKKLITDWRSAVKMLGLSSAALLTADFGNIASAGASSKEKNK